MKASSSVILYPGKAMELLDRTQSSYLNHAMIFLLILFMSSSQPSAAPAATATNAATDRLALLSFKSLISSDPSGVLSSWSNATLSLCQWPGVTCGGRLHPDRVTTLNLDYCRLAGPISPHIANLTFLRRLKLAGNKLHGPIPPDLGRLSRLSDLNLSMNYLDGEIPASLTRCSNLRIISLRKNQLTGAIPREIGSLSQLQLLNLGENNIAGTIPPSLGNISSLLGILLHNNALEGSIPASVGKLARLQLLELTNNKLSGSIPSSLYNLSSIGSMVLSDNRLVGTLSPSMFDSLPNLNTLYLYGNQLHGPIPNSLPNASSLADLDLKGNNFTGKIPSNLGNLQYLYWIDLSQNQLEARDATDWDFLNSLTNCSLLEVVGIEFNRLGGILPNSIGNLSPTLLQFSMGWNQISGGIPDGIGNLVNLTVFTLNDNCLTGVIPATIGRLQQLHVVSLSGNRLTGQIPYSIGNLNQLVRLYLEGNNLNGTIPTSFGNLKSLQELDLSQNRLHGAIPKELVSLPSLATHLDLSHNLLTGSLPLEVSNLMNLNGLNVSDNRLSGEIPSTLGNCQSLEYLNMQGNLFQGTIPQSLSNLNGLRDLDLSHNHLSGVVPQFMGRMRGLLYLNLSFNDLEGGVPNEGIFQNTAGISVLGNKLCGGNLELHLPPCSSQSAKGSKQKQLVLKVIVPVLSVALGLIIFLVILATLHRMRALRKKSALTSSIEGQFIKVSYAELLKSTDGLSSSNLIGVGSVGSVYKGTMDSIEGSVAVKVLNLQQRGASKSFIAECEVLRSIRHRNLLKILTICSSIDFKGDDFKALVLEFMPNGSLEKWLHPMASEPSKLGTLSLIQRLNIAIDVASALEYLHHYGQTPIVHCDLKPNNVLLDADMCAHVGDFGLARFLSENTEEQQTRSIGIKGTIGYVPPEYGMGGQASTRGDVYSYGILLLELFTGKRPTDDMFSGLSLRNYVETAFPERVMDIVDPHLLLLEDGRETQGNMQNMNDERAVEERKCLISVIGIGLSCSKEDPRERAEMGDITKELHAARDVLLRFKRIHDERRPDLEVEVISAVNARHFTSEVN